MSDNLIVPTGEFMLMFPRLFTPLQAFPTAKAYYSCTMFFNKGFAALKEAVEEEAEKRWGAKWRDESDVRLPFRAAADRFGADYSGYTMTIARSTNKPLVSKLIEDRMYLAGKDDLYPGCICTAEVSPFSYDTNTSPFSMIGSRYKGVGLALISITKLREDASGDQRAELEALEAL